VREAVEAEQDPVRKADAALLAVLRLFASHRSLARLFLVETAGAGPELAARMAEVYRQFTAFIRENLEAAAAQGAIAPLDTELASQVWFGALKEVVSRWALAESPPPLEQSFPAVRALLLRSVGVLQTPSTQNRALIQSWIAEARRRSKRLGRPVLVSWTEACAGHTPLGFFARGASLGPDRVFWYRPADGCALVGIGSALALEPSGPDRFGHLERRWRELLADAVVHTDPLPDGAKGPGATLLGGLAFAPIPSSADAAGPTPWSRLPRDRFLLPRFALTVAGGRQWLTTNLLVGPDDDVDALDLYLPSAQAAPVGRPSGEPSQRDVRATEAWSELVDRAAGAVRGGELEKVVLAREVELRAHPGFHPESALERLAADYPSCTTFALVGEGTCFLGATPERLVRVVDRRVDVSCLAGTFPRGATPEEDDRLGRELLASTKNRTEHEVVARMLRDRLAPLCAELDVPDTPQLLRVRNVQHLYTPVVGLLLPGVDALRVVESLHPTPAVGGYPIDAALRFIDEHERLDRGWYAGPFGWIDADGNADFAVAIRSGLLFDPLPEGGFAAARLYAGCGIVGDSEAESELDESRLKLRPMLAALGGGR
jgi:isochorismate synthase